MAAAAGGNDPDTKFCAEAELTYALYHPAVDGTFGDIQEWWTRKGVGAQLINLYCRKDVDAASDLLRLILTQLALGKRQGDFPIHNQLAKEVGHPAFEARLKWVVGYLDTLTTHSRVPVNGLKSETIRQTEEVVEVGTTITDWKGQFVSVTPRDVRNRYESHNLGMGELQGHTYELVWPEKADTIPAWYLSDREMVLPRGCTFEVIEALGRNKWKAKVHFPDTFKESAVQQALELDRESEDVQAAKGLIEDNVFETFTRERNKWDYDYEEVSVADIQQWVTDFRNQIYSGDRLIQPLKIIAELLKYYCHIEDLVDAEALMTKINKHNMQFYDESTDHAAGDDEEGEMYKILRRRMRQKWSSTKPDFIEPAIEHIKTFRREDILQGLVDMEQIAWVAIDTIEEANLAASSGFQELGTKRNRSHDDM